MRKLHAALAVASFAAAGVVACISTPKPGEVGKPRYAINVRGSVPLDVLPPTSDRNGNLYLLATSGDDSFVQTAIGIFGGGWGSCSSDAIGKVLGDNPVMHGWTGFTQDTAYFWAGGALFGLVGSAVSGGCVNLLHSDPQTGSILYFQAIMPYVHDAPSRKSLVALLRNDTDVLPYWTYVDLNVARATTYNAFSPSDATSIIVAGVGADPSEELGFVVLQYKRGDQTFVEGRFLSVDAQVTAAVPIRGLDMVDEYGVAGNLQRSGDGLVAGLLKTGQLITFNERSGAVKSVPAGLTAVGVHLWQGKLWLVGTADGRPVIAPISANGTVGGAQVWSASEAAARSISQIGTVIDDRALPSRNVRWAARNATGDFPFLGPYSLDYYADGTTLWTIAGPSYDAGGASITEQDGERVIAQIANKSDPPSQPTRSVIHEVSCR